MISNLWTGTASQELEAYVLGRKQSLYAGDVAFHSKDIEASIRGKRILVVGGAGSIGAVNVALVLDYDPASLDVVDISENGLAELVRDLRSSRPGMSSVDFRTLPLDYGSPIMERLLRDARPYDVVMNFAALKHVRTEKDVYSLLQMLNTNVIKHRNFLSWLEQYHSEARYFAVSTDKAANSTSLMGASKRLMESVVFGARGLRNVTSTRFANVAFSNGSLLQSFLIRLSKRQLLAAPCDTRRYFVTLREAGDICLLSATTAPDRHLLVPRFEPEKHLHLLEEIAEQVLRFHRLTPVRFTDESEARKALTALSAEGRYPLLITPLDTSGEKPYEEFVGDGETALEVGLRELLGIPYRAPSASMNDALDDLAARIGQADRPVTKADLVSILHALMPSMRHVETGKNLDQRV